MPPTAPIDSGLSPTNSLIYWVLESASIWLTENLGGGTSTWVEKYTAAAFETLMGCSNATFKRIRVPEDNMVGVLVSAQASGEEDFTAYFLVSNSRGATWNAYEIEDGLTGKEYTVDTKTINITSRVGFWSTNGWAEFTRKGDDENTYNPWALAFSVTSINNPTMSLDPRDQNSTPGHPGEGNSIHTYYDGAGGGAGVVHGGGNSLMGGGGAAGEAYLDDYFGVGGWTHVGGIDTHNLPKEANRIYCFGQNYGWFNPPLTASITFWVFWNVPSPSMPSALDYAPTNHAWWYVGLNDKIMASEDGGVTWTMVWDSTGAYDICVHSTAAGYIYIWSTTGGLNGLKKETGQETMVLVDNSLMSETALNVPLRIAHDASTGRLLAIPNGTTLKQRYLGAVTDLKTGLTGGTGLHVYTGQKLIFLDNADIWISDDLYAATPTITAKQGGWSEYSGPVNAHRMLAT